MIKHAEFIKSLTDIVDRPQEQFNEMILVGRSNVGKSSFINTLTNRKKLAKVSQTPGKTITLNFYLLDNCFYMIDAPGYGYAKRSRTQQHEFIDMLINYLEESPYLKEVFILIDFKVGPTKDDLDMYQALQQASILTTIIFTKQDKVNSSQRQKQLKLLLEKLNNPKNYIITSSETRIGYDKVYEKIKEYMV